MKWITILPFAFAVFVNAAENKPAGPTATKPKAETFLDPAKGGADYADQGEYRNDWGGAQVMALGAGEFRMVISSGLPGRLQRDKPRIPAWQAQNQLPVRTIIAWNWPMAKSASRLPLAAYVMEKTEKKPDLGAKPPAELLSCLTDRAPRRGGHPDERQYYRWLQASKASGFCSTLRISPSFKPLGRDGP
jgi:hypothetical protein